MKLLKVTLILISIISFTSCSSIKVATDYDKEIDFNLYNSFAFYKPGIDAAEISDLDKKRILRAIERELVAKEMVKTTNPDLLVSIFTETRENVNIYQNNFGYGWGWNPYFWGPGGFNTVSSNIEGTLYIDLIDAKKNELVWQGLGTGILSLDMDKKEEKINEIVNKIMEKYPPERDQK
ncbi:DUF4136 domain-containing protein [Psychroflexus lacisalsi]|jgi:hypothetical protein|uniref:DUF4136 domain-containing protein n=1 Tax=Psychroflexus lacisalsi TaxID=503928 RepID=A0ABP3VJE0_9FLAO|nr:DUF4136 domain-containing protein [Psychroflexus lacisalsi]MBZ9619423.1 DUF4136 domain-containing protein [Psychroflexus lacisalsi]